MPLRLKKAVSWMVAISGVFAAIAWLAYLGCCMGPNYGASVSGWTPTFCLMLLGIVPLLATFVALRHRRRAALIFFLPVPIIVAWFTYFRLRSSLEETFAGTMANDLAAFIFVLSLLILPGLFWLATGRLRWPPTLSGPLSIGQKIGAFTVILLVVLVGAVAMDFYSADIGECHYTLPPFTKQQTPQQAVFTARVIRSGVLWPARSVRTRSPGSPKRCWALASVQKQFWGLPWWNHKIAIVTLFTNANQNPLRRGETYFIDGDHRPGSLTRLLPVFETFCTRTKRLRDAEVDLRIMRDGPPPNGIRIIGRTVRVTSDHQQEPVPGTEVVIRSASTRLLATSDEAGVYDVSGLPPGRYDIKIRAAEGKRLYEPPTCIMYGWQQPSKSGDIRDCTLIVPSQE